MRYTPHETQGNNCNGLVNQVMETQVLMVILKTGRETFRKCFGHLHDRIWLKIRYGSRKKRVIKGKS